MSFPRYHGIRRFAPYYNSYGESFIDYNHNINRVGILLNGIL